jgi:hypothetical protein
LTERQKEIILLRLTLKKVKYMEQQPGGIRNDIEMEKSPEKLLASMEQSVRGFQEIMADAKGMLERGQSLDTEALMVQSSALEILLNVTLREVFVKANLGGLEQVRAGALAMLEQTKQPGLAVMPGTAEWAQANIRYVGTLTSPDLTYAGYKKAVIDLKASYPGGYPVGL